VDFHKIALEAVYALMNNVKLVQSLRVDTLAKMGKVARRVMDASLERRPCNHPLAVKPAQLMTIARHQEVVRVVKHAKMGMDHTTSPVSFARHAQTNIHGGAQTISVECAMNMAVLAHSAIQH